MRVSRDLIMDPVTQGTVGAILPQGFANRKTLIWATVCGLLGGMAPDLDVLIRSEDDPLLFLEYHRQFTHSLIFIPIGGSFVGLLLFLLVGQRQGYSLKTTLIFSNLGYATHALLDSCTTYGTVLLWPFSDMRFAWNLISIIDPLFTVPILMAVFFGILTRQARYSQWGLAWVILYLSLGFFQHRAAIQLGEKIAFSRGHDPITIDAKPSFANIIVWKVIYEFEGHYYVDAVRVGLKPTIYEGTSIRKLDISIDFPWLDQASVQAADIERFRWFSRGYVARDPHFPNRVVDIRYSLVPNEINSLWSIELSPSNQNDHVSYITQRGSVDDNWPKLRKMLFD